MPLVRRDPPSSGPAAQAARSMMEPMAALRDADPARRREAARALGEARADPAPLAAALAAEGDPRVREALLTALIRIGDAGVLLPFLRSEDAGLRSAVVEALQDLPGQALPYLPALLADPDPDVRLLAAEVARGLPEEEATRLLCARLSAEVHPNVCAAMVDVLAEAGTPEAVPALRALTVRFASDPFLPFAVTAAVARLGGRG
jgi:HEAT repeat protein